MNFEDLNENLECAELEQICPETYGKVDLYRGIGHDLGQCGQTKVVKGREPRSSGIEYHDIMNSAFKEIFGMPIRSDTFFCTGNYEVALDWGNGTAYKVYPANNFVVYWSDTINDLFHLERSKEHLQNLDYSPFIAIHCLVRLPSEQRKSEELERTLADWPLAKEFLTISYPDYRKNYPASAKDSAYKILHDHSSAIYDFFRKMYQKGDTIQNLRAAAASQNEVMIACEFYCWQKCGK